MFHSPEPEPGWMDESRMDGKMREGRDRIKGCVEYDMKSLFTAWSPIAGRSEEWAWGAAWGVGSTVLGR